MLQFPVMQKRAFGVSLGPGYNGAGNSTVSKKEAMERPSAWARDEDLEEGKRLHDLKAVRVSAMQLAQIISWGPSLTN